MRLIPTLLLKNKGLYKGVNFKNYNYIGDPHNAIRVFNDKQVDELFLLDISAQKENRTIDVEFVKRVADECYMPFGVGGGINNIAQIKSLINAGAEKVCINSSAIERPGFIKEASDNFGSQSIVVSIDYKKTFFGNEKVFIYSGRKKTNLDPLRHAISMEKEGAGELLLNCINRDGTFSGLDLEFLRKINLNVSIPVIGAGGLGRNSHIFDCFNKTDISAIAAGSFFVYRNISRSVLINYPDKKLLKAKNK